MQIRTNNAGSGNNPGVIRASTTFRNNGRNQRQCIETLKKSLLKSYLLFVISFIDID